MSLRHLPRLSDLGAIVFDMDGVLVDSEPMHFRATNRMLAQYGASISEEVFRGFIGMGEEDTWNDWRARFQLTAPIAELSAVIDSARVAEIGHGVTPIPAAVELARQLHRRGVPVAIASASTQTVIGAMVKALDLEAAFTCRLSCEDREVGRAKPAPDIYLHAAAVLGQPPARCLAIEDSAPGVRAAKAAGMHCVAVPTDWSRDHDFAVADAVLDSLDALAGHFFGAPRDREKIG